MEDPLGYWDSMAARAAEEFQEHIFTKEIYKDTRDAFLESLKLKALKDHPDSSDARLVMLAKGSQEWKTFLNEQHEVLREYGRKKIKYENAVRRWESARSRGKILREEKERYPGA